MMNYLLPISISLCLGMLVFQELGMRIGRRRVRKNSQIATAGTGVIEGGLFAIWGLLLAFTFSGAASRFDMRRQLLGQEVNAIGTAYLRLDLLPTKDREALKELFRRYVDTRLETYRKASNEAAWKESLARSVELQKEIWNRAHNAGLATGQTPPILLLLPALNEMFDIATTRLVAAHMHPPTVVYLLLFVLCLVCSMFVGFNHASAKQRSWLHMIGFIVINTLVIHIIVDMEYPRAGLIRVDDIDHVLVELRQGLK